MVQESEAGKAMGQRIVYDGTSFISERRGERKYCYYRDEFDRAWVIYDAGGNRIGTAINEAAAQVIVKLLSAP